MDAGKWCMAFLPLHYGVINQGLAVILLNLPQKKRSADPWGITTCMVVDFVVWA